MNTSRRTCLVSVLCGPIAAVLAGVTGCTVVGPDYRQAPLTAPDVPKAWSRPSKGPATASLEWWRQLNSPLAHALVEQAIATHPRSDSVRARLAQLGAAREQQRAALGPQLRAQASGQAQGVLTVLSAAGVSTSQSSQLQASWEVDLFGAVRRAQESAEAREQAEEAGLAEMQVSLTAEVLAGYTSLRTCQSLLRLSNRGLASFSVTQRLVQLSVDEGMESRLQLARVQASLSEARNQHHELVRQCEATENALVELTGHPRETLRALFSAEQGSPLQPPTWSLALPPAAVAARPDVKRAERLLAAANADIGVAQADRFPRLSLVGEIGYSSQQSPGARLKLGTWGFGPALTLPVLDGGQRSGAVKAAQARFDEAHATYRGTVRAAVRDIEDALSHYDRAQRQVEESAQAEQAQGLVLASVAHRRAEGAASQLELEAARRSQLGYEQALVLAEQARVQAWLLLARASAGQVWATEPG